MDRSRRDWLLAMGVGTAAGAVGACWLEELVVSDRVSVVTDATASIRILYNENPLGCCPGARTALANVATQFYGFTETRKLINRLRIRHGLGPLFNTESMAVRGGDATGEHTLALGVGSSELLKGLAQAFCQDGGSVVEPDPSYRAVGRAAQSVSPATEVRRVDLKPDGTLNFAAMSAAVDASTRIVVLTNPNNPTGGTSPRSAIAKFIDSIPEQTVVLVDEAYIEFADETKTSVMPLARARKNVLVTRTFSKFYGLAGLRLGYCVGHHDLVERMRPYLLGIMGINSAAVAACNAALDDNAHSAATRSMVKSFVRTMQTELPRLGFHVWPSSAPFVWAERNDDATQLVDQLEQEGILISGGARWDRPQAVRISAATPAQCERLLAALSGVVG